MANCKSIGDFATSVAMLLADRPGITWEPDDIYRAATIGVDAISSYRPDIFTESQEIALVPGTRQKLPSGVIAIVGTAENICKNADGTTTAAATVSAVDANEIRAFQFYANRKCTPATADSGSGTTPDATNTCGKWLLGGFNFDPRNPGEMSVTPAVPDGLAPKVRITVQTCAPCYSPDEPNVELPCRYIAALTEFTLYLMLGIQYESEAALRASIEHRNTFFNMLGIKYRQDSRFASGYYLGQMGGEKTDPNVMRG